MSNVNLEAMFCRGKNRGLDDDTGTKSQLLALGAIAQVTSGKEAACTLSLSFLGFKMGI